MENIILDGENVDLESLPIDKLKKILFRLNSEELEIKKELDNMLEELN